MNTVQIDGCNRTSGEKCAYCCDKPAYRHQDEPNTPKYKICMYVKFIHIHLSVIYLLYIINTGLHGNHIHRHFYSSFSRKNTIKTYWECHISTWISQWTSLYNAGVLNLFRSVPPYRKFQQPSSPFQENVAKCIKKTPETFDAVFCPTWYILTLGDHLSGKPGNIRECDNRQQMRGN